MAWKRDIKASALTCMKTSLSINVIRQSYNSCSPTLFLSFSITRSIVENTLSTLAVAMGRTSTNLRSL
ncbi:hypothetical protein PAHAL_8G226100 [Panicum hallii]|uniref:Uncharacterized protein n=1 Tax=Panicum hallii TaxID=206008 RepID=A0A2T8I9X2_9POAL|nr:hypothetical protein PAHAL_8G226100 [Panicum hallii]